MKIGGFQKLNLKDYSGHLSCMVLLAGCNLRCPWCFNPDLVLPEKISSKPAISQKDFFKFLKIKNKELDAVIISGGEPTIHWQLPIFCQQIKSAGYKVKLDTNGTNPKMLRELIDKAVLDYVSLDIKAPQDKFGQTTGMEEFSPHYLLNNIDKSINILKQQNKVDYEFKTTLVPGFHTKDDILKIVAWIKPAKRYKLNTFEKKDLIVPECSLLNEFPEQEAMAIKQAIAPFFDVCELK